MHFIVAKFTEMRARCLLQYKGKIWPSNYKIIKIETLKIWTQQYETNKCHKFPIRKKENSMSKISNKKRGGKREEVLI